MAKARLDWNGLTANATASAGLDSRANFDVNMLAGGQWNNEVSAGVRAEAIANAKWDKIELSSEASAYAGAYAKAETKLGTEKSNIGVAI